MSSRPELDASKGNGEKGEPDANAAQRQLLPFEPKSRKPVDNSKITPQAKAGKAKGGKPAAKPAAVGKPISGRSGETSRSAIASGIPDEVSRRMVWRMALLCGIPSALGMLTFVGSYLLVINDVDLPTYAVLLVSLGWFGLGVLGLSYGVLSASWDEEVVGSLVGWDEFTTNWGRMRANWRNNAELAKAAKAEADIEARRAAKKAKLGK
ncbi:MAG: PAM68 family protein [Drouetiella hepatica Uher 2000/2452]|jgi:hypothetical protein|uniref:PAM68 family protein n=1 Tax=Drouetiella hepatica Uher 2000/2452 TaxID=904376 RepID=A0A951ULR3_9CYAN|nr:PAM68 family protein [Drouetiella hepatica Uher 2000/2452]